MPPQSPHYILPSSPDVRCEDRFSILDSDEPEVPFWDLLKEVLRPDVTTPVQLIDIIQTFAVTLRASGNTDYGHLKAYLNKHPDCLKCWPIMRGVALDMPTLFPEHSIRILATDNTSLSSSTHAVPTLRLSRKQAACLVVHQFLCTLREPTWQQGFQDFHIWYSKDVPHPVAADVYLTSIFTYFARLHVIISSPAFDDWMVEYRLHAANSRPLPENPDMPLGSIETIHVPHLKTSPELIGVPGTNACVISANKFVGFGQSATQEEISVGISPEACPVVLVTPPLTDSQVLVVTGAEAMLTTEGQRRDFVISAINGMDEANLEAHKTKWQSRTMLFMDALEIDMIESPKTLPDLDPKNVEREWRKAYTAFSSGKYQSVYTALWGCGAFFGDATVKISIMWCAASAAGVALQVICDGELTRFGVLFEALAETANKQKWTIGHLKGLLDDAHAQDLKKGEFIDWAIRQPAR